MKIIEIVEVNPNEDFFLFRKYPWAKFYTYEYLEGRKYKFVLSDAPIILKKSRK